MAGVISKLCMTASWEMKLLNRADGKSAYATLLNWTLYVAFRHIAKNYFCLICFSILFTVCL